MTALISGGAGFIGRHLCKRLLAEENNVIAVDNFSNASLDNIKDIICYNNFRLIKGDISNIELTDHIFKNNKIDIVYHLASNTSVRTGQENPVKDISNTLNSTLAVLQMAAKYGVQKLVFTSSSTVYGEQADCLSERSITRPISIYGASKLASEAYICAFSNKYNLQSWVLRLCNVVGEDMNHGIIGDIRKQLFNNTKTLQLLGSGNQEKPFLYVEDAVDGFLYVVNHALDKNNLYLIGNDDTVTIKRIAEIVANEYHIGISFNQATIAWQGDVERYSYDISKVKELGWYPKYNSEEAIRKSIM